MSVWVELQNVYKDCNRPELDSCQKLPNTKEKGGVTKWTKAGLPPAMVVGRAAYIQEQRGSSSSAGKCAWTSTFVLTCCDPDNMIDTLAKHDDIYKTVLITEQDDLRSAEGNTKL